MTAVEDNALTVGALIEQISAELVAAGLFYGHGTDNAVDESAALVFHVCDIDHQDAAQAYSRPVSATQQRRVGQVLAERVQTRKPLAYLLGEAWFAGLRFAVDERVLIPRSPIAELILERFDPWLAPQQVRRILEIGTGSGCIAIACAKTFPTAQVVATDISAAALSVAAANAAAHGVSDRLQLVETDHAAGVSGQFDLLVTNPPYVPENEQPDLPLEYSFEPAMGLYSGADGLDSARRILQDAPLLLSDHGVLVLEVGAQWQALEQAFPTLPFTWLEFAAGGEGVALLGKAELVAAQQAHQQQ